MDAPKSLIDGIESSNFGIIDWKKANDIVVVTKRQRDDRKQTQKEHA